MAGKQLVAYFSVSGVTKEWSERVADLAGAKIFEIEPMESYTEADLDWRDPESRSSVEMKDPSSRPQMKEALTDTDFDVMFLGFPIWWHVAPRLVNTFLESIDISGKLIIVFATSGGTGSEKAVEALKESYPQARFVDAGLINDEILDKLEEMTEQMN